MKVNQEILLRVFILVFLLSNVCLAQTETVGKKKLNAGLKVAVQSKLVPNSQLEYRYNLLNAKDRQTLEKRLDYYMNELRKAYYSNDSEKYEKLTVQLLWYTSRIPVYFLEVYHNRFIDNVKKHGVGPFLSYYIDYGVRLANIRTKTSLRKYKTLSNLYKPNKLIKKKHCNLFKPRKSFKNKHYIFVRNKNNEGFTKYSENVGWVLSMFVYSNVGESYSKTGIYTASNYLGAIALIDICAEKGLDRYNEHSTDQQSITKALEYRNFNSCSVLSDEIESLMNGNNFSQPDFASSLDGLIEGGMNFGLSDCLAGLMNDNFSKTVGRIESYLACRNTSESSLDPTMQKLISMLPAEGGFTKIIYSDSGVEATKLDIPNIYGGYSTTTHYPEAYCELNDGYYQGELWTHTETNANGENIYSSSEFHGTTESGDDIYYTSEVSVNPDTGAATSKESLSMPGSASVSTTTSFDSDGNITGQTTAITINFDDGSSKTYTTTVDADGNVTDTVTETPASTSGDSEGTSTTQPVNDVIVDNCASLLTINPEEGEILSKLETQIYPSIDDVPSEPVLSDCIGSPDSGPTKCTSVWLCLEGQVDENCKCTNNDGYVNVPPPIKNTCRQIRCADGADCNPATGTCQRVEGNLGSPEPPLPISVGINPEILLESTPVEFDQYMITLDFLMREVLERRKGEINFREFGKRNFCRDCRY